MQVTIYQTLIVSDELVDMINIRMWKIHPSCNLPGMQQTMGHFLASKRTWMIKFLKFIPSTVWCVNLRALQVQYKVKSSPCTTKFYGSYPHTLDGKNPAPVVFTRFYTSQVVVWDFWITNSTSTPTPNWCPPSSRHLRLLCLHLLQLEL